MIRTEYDDAAFQHHFKKGPHQKLFFDLKYKNYNKAKMKGGLGWIKKT